METKTLLPAFGRRGLFAPLANLREEMDRLFNDWLKEVDFEPLRMFEGGTFLPHLDVIEHERELEIKVELPGMDEKEIALELTPLALILSGEKKLAVEEKEEGYLRRERRFGAFSRTIPLPWEVDVAKAGVVAAFDKGMLTIRVPKPEKVLTATRKIAIGT